MASSALEIQDFRLALAVRFLDGLGVQMLGVIVGWQIYQLTKDPLLLGCVGLAEALPYIGAALWAGQLTDRGEKSGIVAKAEVGMLLGATGLTLLAFSRQPPLLPIYLLLAWLGLCRCFQWVAMTTYMQSVVPKEIFPKAAAWGTSVWHAATIAGPVLGGATYGAFGGAAAYGAVAGCFLAAFFCAARLARMPAVPADGQAGLEGLLSGARFVFSERVILAAMTLDMVGVLFGGVEGILPMFAERLGAGAAGLGLLRAAPAVGALVCSLYLAHHQPFKRMGAAFIGSVAAFGLCIVAFAVSRHFYLSLALLAAGGMVDGVGMVIRSSLYQALTPDRLRGRVSSVNGIFIRSSNQIGAFESGLAAKAMGLVPSVVFGGCVALASAAVALWKAPELARWRAER